MERLELAATLHSIGSLAEAEPADPSLIGDRVDLSLAKAQSLCEAAAAAGPAEVDDISEVVRAVGERWDGQGYPDGLGGGEIPLASRVIHACETYDALTARRGDGEGLSPLEACRELVDRAGSQLDPLVVATLIGHLRRTHVLLIADPAEAESDPQRSAAWSASPSSG
jgi:HD-GYP domain-containing protein (c-di-GMP phosphodiesterase class II)